MVGQDLRECRLELEGIYNLMGVADPSGSLEEHEIVVLLSVPCPPLPCPHPSLPAHPAGQHATAFTIALLPPAWLLLHANQWAPDSGALLHAPLLFVMGYRKDGPVEGECLVYRNPGLVVEDILKLRAVEGREVRALLPPNAQHCIIFSTKGTHAVPDCMAGGDLDGDLYTVCFNKEVKPLTLNPNPLNLNLAQAPAISAHRCAVTSCKPFQGSAFATAGVLMSAHGPYSLLLQLCWMLV